MKNISEYTREEIIECLDTIEYKNSADKSTEYLRSLLSDLIATECAPALHEL